MLTDTILRYTHTANFLWSMLHVAMHTSHDAKDLDASLAKEFLSMETFVVFWCLHNDLNSRIIFTCPLSEQLLVWAYYLIICGQMILQYLFSSE